ncbi:hypothetical protein GCM10029963_32640 [Micromonospora andamanensis]|uniref:DUF6907 domain-containing protein n=1 Tax=Micromonospora andamanensis TaxID=1287068 RepID=UPI001A636BAA|nr:hypothetical protein Vwe01_61470 [Micromonospora andamanensis]
MGEAKLPSPEIDGDPVWCVHGHFDDDRAVDRRHVSDPVLMRTTLAEAVDRGEQLPPSRRWEPAHLTIRLVQRLNELHPVLTLHRASRVIEPWVTVTVAEAGQLADLLILAAERGELPAPADAAPEDSPFWQDTACPRWCAGHHRPDDAPEDRVHGGELLPNRGAAVDLVLEKADEDGPQQLEVSVTQHYRSRTAVVYVIKSERSELLLTPAEARVLAGHLKQLGDTSGLPADTSRRWEPINGATMGDEPIFPCPHRHHWCQGHPKHEIVDYRLPGNSLLHSGPVATVTCAVGDVHARIDISIDSLAGYRPRLLAYLQVHGGDGGAQLDSATIDDLIVALQQTRGCILSIPGQVDV